MTSFLYGASVGFIVCYLLGAAAWGRLFASIPIEMTGYQVVRAAILWPAAMIEITNRGRHANASPTSSSPRTSH